MKLGGNTNINNNKLTRKQTENVNKKTIKTEMVKTQ